MLQRIFVSCSLWEQDQSVVDFFRQLFQSHEIIPRTVGIDVDAETDEEAARIAKNEIKLAKGVIVILTPRYYVNGYKSSEWTYEEPSMGFYGDKPVYLFYERGVNLKGVTASTTQIKVEFDRHILNDERERNRLEKHVEWIKSDLESKTVGDFLGAIGTVAFGLFAIYGVIKFFEAIFGEKR